MDGMTKSLLSEYYGFGSEGHFEKFISSHTGRSSLEIQTYEVEVTNVNQDEEEDENKMKDSFHNAHENISSKLNRRNLLVEEPKKSSRVLREKTLKKDDISVENYETFFKTNLTMNDYIFLNEKSEVKHNESAANADKRRLKPTDEISDTSLILQEESVSEMRSTISSPMPKKKLSRKLKTSVIPLPPPPKRDPLCNGVYLDLTSTGISVFPLEMLDEFPNLRMLYLENNNLAELPNELFPTLRFLNWLDVRNNQLTNLPNNIAHHPCLETILLQGNKIERLPLELFQVPRLRGLQILRNPLVFPPNEIVSQGCSAILGYLREEWKRLNPEGVIEAEKLHEQDKELGAAKPDLTTILCYKPKSILKKKKIADQLVDISSIASTSSSDPNINEKTTRQKSWDYKPSNRCSSEGEHFSTAMRLMWISKVKEMLDSQALALQRIKDKKTLKDWRQDKTSSYKSTQRALQRTADDVPFAIDLNGISLLLKQDLSMRRCGKTENGKRGIISPTNINQKIRELFKSLSQLQLARQSQTLSPRSEQKLLEIEIRKISDLQDEVQSLKRYNDVVVAPLMNSHHTPRKQIERPSFII